MAHTTRYGNHYTTQEWQETQEIFENEAREADEFLEASELLVEKAAGYLNREFPDVPVSKWAVALESAAPITFTSKQKQERFEAAEKWLEAEMRKLR